jgi:hypothetical protein
MPLRLVNPLWGNYPRAFFSRSIAFVRIS